MDNVKRLKADRTQSKLITDFDIAKYRKQTFGMFAGKSENITLQFKGELIDVIFDKFGLDTKINRVEPNKFSTKVQVLASPMFYGWCASFGDDLKLVAPQSVVTECKAHLSKVMEQYH